jgi:hypothetical protein
MKSASTNDSPAFDAAAAVAEYRRVIKQRDAQTTKRGRATYDATAERLRQAWKEWQGEDSLHEMAFGEPFECGAVMERINRGTSPASPE